MTLAFSPEERSPLVAALLAERGVAPGEVDLAIDARDEMLAFLLAASEGDRDRALATYFRSGLAIADAFGQVLAWRFGGPEGVGRLLDFASGYGRVSRFLLRGLPRERVWVADVYPEAVRFQEERFGVRGLVSTVDPAAFSCAERFDAVLVTSLFTHLPEERFVGWLAALAGLLRPGGLLAWSVHDQEVLAPGVDLPAGGILFEELSESGSLAARDYGSSWVSESFVRAAALRALGSRAAAASLHRLPRGLCNFQDLYLLVMEPGVDFSRLRFQGEPELFVEHASLSGDAGGTGGARLELSGWAVQRGPGEVSRLEVLLDGEVLAAAPIGDERPDVAALLGGERFLRAGWRCSCPLPAGASHAAAALLLRVVDGRDVAQPLFVGTLQSLLLAAARCEVGYLVRERWRLESRLAEAEGRLVQAQAQAAHEAGALRARLAAMEASRFWKLRNAWFAVKRGLGMGRGSRG
jgi:SAM-dependent methyltransferase